MKILLIMDPGITVPPLLYGGHERLVHMFAEEYQKMGHTVHLLAGPGSNISGTTHTFGINDLKRSKIQKLRELFKAWKYLFSNRKNYDLIHNFGRLAYLIPILNTPIKKIMTYGRPVSKKGIKMVTTLPNQNLIFTACSNYCVSTGNIAGHWETVYNAINFSNYTLVKTIEESAPLMFLGRLDKIKGVHHAINVALKANKKLIVGGNIPDTADNYQYYKEVIEPLFDGEKIIYLGTLNDEQKNHYLGKAQALLFPIDWDEPFGMVMVEAMACGTPVIGFKRGSVPEVISEGLNGFVVSDENTMLSALQNIDFINREQCRVQAEIRFNVGNIAEKYLSLFQN